MQDAGTRLTTAHVPLRESSDVARLETKSLTIACAPTPRWSYNKSSGCHRDSHLDRTQVAGNSGLTVHIHAAHLLSLSSSSGAPPTKETGRRGDADANVACGIKGGGFAVCSASRGIPGKASSFKKLDRGKFGHRREEEAVVRVEFPSLGE
jgi:hypothetical protein